MFSINYKPSQRKDQAADRERNAAAERRRIAQAQAQQAVRDKKELEEHQNAIGCPWICFCVSLVLVGGVSIWLSEIEIGMAEDLVRALGFVDLP